MHTNNQQSRPISFCQLIFLQFTPRMESSLDCRYSLQEKVSGMIFMQYLFLWKWCENHANFTLYEIYLSHSCLHSKLFSVFREAQCYEHQWSLICILLYDFLCIFKILLLGNQIPYKNDFIHPEQWRGTLAEQKPKIQTFFLPCELKWFSTYM